MARHWHSAWTWIECAERSRLQQRHRFHPLIERERLQERERWRWWRDRWCHFRRRSSIDHWGVMWRRAAVPFGWWCEGEWMQWTQSPSIICLYFSSMKLLNILLIYNYFLHFHIIITDFLSFFSMADFLFFLFLSFFSLFFFLDWLLSYRFFPFLLIHTLFLSVVLVVFVLFPFCSFSFVSSVDYFINCLCFCSFSFAAASPYQQHYQLWSHLAAHLLHNNH